MTFVEHLHDANVLTTAFQYQFEQTFQIEVDVGYSGKQSFFNKRTDVLISLAKASGVVCISGHALHAVQQNLLQ